MESLATIEGRNPVIEAIKNDREIDKIMIANSAKEGSIKKIIGMAKEKNGSTSSRCYSSSKWV